MKEKNVENLMRVHLGKVRPTLKLWRNAVSFVWAGRVVSHLPQLQRVTLEAADGFTAGLCIGSSDLIGRYTTTVTPQMVGKKIAVFTAIEVKKDRTEKPTDEQVNFVREVKEAGGIAGVAYDNETAEQIFKTWHERMEA